MHFWFGTMNVSYAFFWLVMLAFVKKLVTQNRHKFVMFSCSMCQFPWESWSIRSPHTRKILGSNPSGDTLEIFERFSTCCFRIREWNELGANSPTFARIFSGKSHKNSQQSSEYMCQEWWRNGSAFDSRSKGWGFDSLSLHFNF